MLYFHRFWAAVCVLVCASQAVSAGEKPAGLPDVPEARASFGAASTEESVYIYGGHIGTPHSHSSEDQTGGFYRLDFAQPDRWHKLPAGQKLQGLALVAAKGCLYRIGGMHAKNKDPEQPHLISVDRVEKFDPKVGQWAPFVSLPQGRSSHDAVVVGSKIYVVGGWELRGKEDPIWHEESLVIDLDAKQPAWKILPKQPFVRRALAAGAAGGKIFALGGITPKGDTSRAVNVFDTATNSWNEAPGLPGKDLHGFGVSAFGLQGQLYACGMNGTVYSLRPGAENWQEAGKLENGRFFHRLVPMDQENLLIIAGAIFGSGHTASVERFPINQPTSE